MTPVIDRGGARHPLVELMLARLREFYREPEALFWAFVFPVVMSLALAIAFPSGANRPVIVGVPPGHEAASIRTALEASPQITLKHVPPGDEVRALREGEVHVVVSPTEPPTYKFDPDRTESQMARLVVNDLLARAAGRVDPWRPTEEPLTVAGSRYVDWVIPGIVGLNIMFTGVWGIGFPIVQTRMRKLLKRMVASPMRKREFLLAQVLARMLFLAPEVVVPLGFGALALGMPINGNPIEIAAVAIVGALAFGGLGLLIASRAKTFEAISGLANITTMPMLIASGVFFSSTNFPDAIQPLVQVLPLTAFNDAFREVVLEGAPLPAVGGDLLLLGGWAVVSFAIALRLFRWR